MCAIKCTEGRFRVNKVHTLTKTDIHEFSCIQFTYENTNRIVHCASVGYKMAHFQSQLTRCVDSKLLCRVETSFDELKLLLRIKLHVLGAKGVSADKIILRCTSCRVVSWVALVAVR